MFIFHPMTQCSSQPQAIPAASRPEVFCCLPSIASILLPLVRIRVHPAGMGIA